MSYGESKWGKPPQGYIPGYGRGAVGFFTRSDIGPARNLAGQTGGEKYNSIIKYSNTSNQTQSGTDKDPNEIGDYSETRYDKWSGYESNLFANSEYDEEDKAADVQFNMIENYMDERRKSKKQAKLMESLEKQREEKPTIKQTFSDIKKDLSKITKDEWLNIPDIGDFTVKKRKIERFAPVPDQVIERGLNDNQIANSLDQLGGATSTMNNITQDNLNELGQAKNVVLSYVFDKMSTGVSGQTSVNPIGYITSMNSAKPNVGGDISDIKKARKLMKSVITSNPKNFSGWIAAARIEELDGKINEARNIILQALENILDSDDLWIEAARLHPPDASKALLTKGIAHLPHSKKLWLAAANSEHDKDKKVKTLRLALQNVPTADEIWKAAIELENEEEAKVLLYRAVECIPGKADFWLALAKLEDYENARAVINKARMALPHDYTIWVHAAKLEEAQGADDSMIDKLIGRSIKTLWKNGVTVPRDKWVTEAENCEVAGSLKTSSAIIKTAIQSDKELPVEGRKQIWLEIADQVKNKGYIESARQIYDALINEMPDEIDIWMGYIGLEKSYGKNNSHEHILQKAIEKCPSSEIFWLMYAKYKWLTDSIKAGKQILIDALNSNPDSEEITLALVKLEKEDGNYDRAKDILNNTANQVDSAKILMKLVQLEREEGNLKQTFELCEKALAKHSDHPKLWMIYAQIKEEIGDTEAAIKIYERGIDQNKRNPYLYICLSRLYSKLEKEAVARSILEKAQKILPKEPKIWVESIKFEIGLKSQASANLVLSRALKECPNSGIIWGLAIEIETHNKHSKAADALSKCEHDENVMLAVAKLYTREKHFEKARKWYENAIRVNPDLGDIWVYYYQMEKQYGDEENARNILKRCEDAAPRHGDLWVSISKKVENWNLKTGEILVKAAELVNYEILE